MCFCPPPALGGVQQCLFTEQIGFVGGVGDHLAFTFAVASGTTIPAYRSATTYWYSAFGSILLAAGIDTPVADDVEHVLQFVIHA